MAWIHLHTAEAIFTSSYGNILAIKLLLNIANDYSVDIIKLNYMEPHDDC